MAEQPFYNPNKPPKGTSTPDMIERERGFITSAFLRVSERVVRIAKRLLRVEKKTDDLQNLTDPTFLAQGDARWGTSGATYENPDPMPEDVGGWLAGTTFTPPKTLEEMFTGLLYPYQFPTFSAFSISGQATAVEVGTTISGAALPFIWTTTNPLNVQPNTFQIEDVTGALVLASGLADDGSEALPVGPVQKLTNTPNVWRITGTNTQAGNFTRDFTVNWQWRFYYGTQAATTLSEAQIEALTNNPLRSGFAGAFTFAAGDYKYFCWADSLGGASSFTDQATSFNVPMADVGDDPAYSNTQNGISYALVSVTNTFGVVENYRVYRTKNTIGAAITIIVA